MSSKEAKLSGPAKKAAMSDPFFSLTPGVTSTSASRGASSGCRAAVARAVMPPRDMPTNRRDSGASIAMTWAMSSAMAAGSRARLSPGQSEWPCPGRSMATSGRCMASATVSQVWAFCPPPWTRTRSAGASPHTRALT